SRTDSSRGEREVSELRTDREAECFDFFRPDAGCPNNGCALFVRREKIIRVTSVPDRIDGDRVSDDDDIFAARVRTANVPQQIGIRWKRGDDDVGLKAVE